MSDHSSLTGPVWQRLSASLDRLAGGEASTAVSDAARRPAPSGAVLLLEATGRLRSAEPRILLGWTEQLRQAVQRPDEDGPDVAAPAADDVDFAEACALHALDALGATLPGVPRRISRLMEDGSRESVAEFAAELSRRPGAMARDLLWLIHCAETREDRGAPSALHATLDWLIEAQDPATGMWEGPRLERAAAGALTAHAVVPLLQYLNRPVLRLGRTVETLLAFLAASGKDRIDLEVRQQLACVYLLRLGLTVLPHDADRIRELLMVTGSDLEAALTSAADSLDVAPPDSKRWCDTWLQATALAHIRAVCPDPSGVQAIGWRHRDWPGPGSQPPSKQRDERRRRFISLWERPLRAAPRAVQQPVVSVVIPCHNLGVYLHDAVSSVLAQTLESFELIVVDDGSDDELTIEAVRRLRQCARVIDGPRGGPGGARNRGITASRGRYICCLDADDRLAQDFLRRSAQVLDEAPDVGFVSAGTKLFDERDQEFSLPVPHLAEQLAANRFIVSSVFRRSAWEAVGGYCETFSHPGIEDWDLWISFMEHGYRPVCLPEPLFEYRVRAGSMSGHMTVPAVWRSLVRELVKRHENSFRTHVADVVALVAERAADLHAWALDRERARSWFEHKADAWERETQARERAIGELKGWIAELEAGKLWLEDQWREWKRIAEVRQARIDELQSAGSDEGGSA